MMAWVCIWNRCWITRPRRTRAGRASGSARGGGAAAASRMSSCSLTSPWPRWRHLDRQIGQARQELVQRWVEQAHRHGETIHGLEDLDEIAPLQREQRSSGRARTSSAPRRESTARPGRDARRGTCARSGQADALRAEAAGAAASSAVSALVRTRRWRTRSATCMRRCTERTMGSASSASGVDLALEVLDDRGGLDRHLAEEDLTGRTIDRDGVALLDDDAAGRRELLPRTSTSRLLGAAHAGAAHATGDDGGVRGLASAWSGSPVPQPFRAGRQGWSPDARG